MPLAALGPILIGAAGTSAAATAGAWGAIGAGAKIGSDLYGAHKQADTANNVAAIQAQSARDEAAAKQAAADKAEAFQRQQAENEWLNSQNVQHANYDQSKARYGSIAGVASQYGLNLGGMPDYVPGIDPHYDTGATPTPPAGSIAGTSPATGSASSPSAFLKGLLDQGVDPQAAAAQTNQKFNLQTGSQAQYYAPSAQTSGKAVIGLPDSYISQEPTGWSLTPRSGAAAPKPGTIAAASSVMAPPAISAPMVNTAIPDPYQPGTIAAYGRMR